MSGIKNGENLSPRRKRTYQDIGRLYGLAGKSKKKMDAVVELEVLSSRITESYESNMELITKEVGALSSAFQDLNNNGIDQLKSLQQNANVALQQFVTATEIITKADMSDHDRESALNDVRKASLEIVSRIIESIANSMKTVEDLNNKLAQTNITQMAAETTQKFLEQKLRINEDLFMLEKGYREGESIRKSLTGTVFPPPPPPPANTNPAIALPPSTTQS